MLKGIFHCFNRFSRKSTSLRANYFPPAEPKNPLNPRSIHNSYVNLTIPISNNDWNNFQSLPRVRLVHNLSNQKQNVSQLNYPYKTNLGAASISGSCTYYPSQLRSTHANSTNAGHQRFSDSSGYDSDDSQLTYMSNTSVSRQRFSDSSSYGSDDSQLTYISNTSVSRQRFSDSSGYGSDDSQLTYISNTSVGHQYTSGSDPDISLPDCHNKTSTDSISSDYVVEGRNSPRKSVSFNDVIEYSDGSTQTKL